MRAVRRWSGGGGVEGVRQCCVSCVQGGRGPHLISLALQTSRLYHALNFSHIINRLAGSE